MSPGRAQEIEKIKSKSHHVGSEIYGVNGMGRYFRVSSRYG